MKSCEVRLLYTTEHNRLEFEVQTTLAQALHHMSHPDWGFNFCDIVCFVHDLQEAPIELIDVSDFVTKGVIIDDPQLLTLSSDSLQWGERASSRVERLNRNALQLYQDLITEGVEEESARAVLPQTMLVRYRVRFTPERASSFIRGRDEYTPEMQRLALCVRECFKEAPYV